MNKKTIITALLIFVALAGQAQTKVIGHVVNERGEKVEYVSIGIEEDSVGVISDAQGHFAQPLPSLLYAQRLGKINVLACHLFAINAYI